MKENTKEEIKEIVEEDDIDYADDDIFSELNYELDGNFEIKVAVLNKPTI
jgi:hypothetical protein